MRKPTLDELLAAVARAPEPPIPSPEEAPPVFDPPEEANPCPCECEPYVPEYDPVSMVELHPQPESFK